MKEVKMRPMGMGRRGPFIERGYRDGGRFQWVRETVINAMEAGATRIEFGVEWQAVASQSVYRRVICDNGRGMLGSELDEFLNHFGAGGKAIGDEHGNYGIGAKTSLLPWNPYGVVVISYVAGRGSLIWLFKDQESGEYGARIFPVEHEDGSVSLESVIAPFLDEEHGVDWGMLRPSWLTGNGTIIVLMGQGPADDTVVGDPGHKEAGLKDIALYLNRRLWSMRHRNADVQITVTEFKNRDKKEWPKAFGTDSADKSGIFRRNVKGAKYYLTEAQHIPDDARGELKSGTLHLSDGHTEIDWYLWQGRKTHDENGKQRWTYPYAPTKGFIAVAYQNELHDHSEHHSTYRNFGIVESDVRNLVWIVIRPPISDGKVGVYQKADRNQLCWVGGLPLPMEDWAAEFADNMPHEIVSAINRARGSSVNTADQIDEEWAQRMAERYIPRFAMTTFKADPGGGFRGGGSEGQQRRFKPAPKVEREAPDPRAPHSGGVKAPTVTPFGNKPARESRVKGSLPKYEIIHNTDDIEDNMLAVYLSPNKIEPAGKVIINGSHPVLDQQVKYWQARFAAHHGEKVRSIVENVYGMVAVYKIAHSHQLRGYVDGKIIDEMRSPRSLTMALLGIMAEDALIERRLSMLGKQRKRQEEAA